MGKINSENIWNNAQAGYAAYSNAMASRKATNPKQQAESVENLIKYLENKPIAQESGDTFTSTIGGVVPGIAIFEAPRGLSWLKKAKGLKVDSALNVAHAANAGKDAVSAAAQLKNYAAPVTDSLKQIVTGSGKFTTRVKNYMDSVATFEQNSRKLTEAMATFRKAEKAGQTVEEFTKAAKAAEGAAKTGKVASAFKGIKSTIAKPFAKVAEKVPFLGKVGKVFKGSGTAGFAVIGGGIELATEVVPTFKQLGFKAGVKQTAKSAVKVAADVGGWAVGAKAGAAAGAAIGSIFPGVGTAIGAAIGTFVGGIIGSWGAGKIAKAVTGPTEREKAEAKASKEQTKTVMANSKDVETLKKLAMEKVQATAQQNGYIDAESQKALEELEKLNNPFANGPMYA